MTRKRKTKGGVQPADIYAGSVLRALRIQKGWSQEKLASAIGLSFQQIQKYERGTNRMSVGRVDQIAKALECSPLIFFLRDDRDLPC